jgi:hypothetical protein
LPRCCGTTRGLRLPLLLLLVMLLLLLLMMRGLRLRPRRTGLLRRTGLRRTGLLRSLLLLLVPHLPRLRLQLGLLPPLLLLLLWLRLRLCLLARVCRPPQHSRQPPQAVPALPGAVPLLPPLPRRVGRLRLRLRPLPPQPALALPLPGRSPQAPAQLGGGGGEAQQLVRGRLSLFQITENHNLAISAAKAVGCHVINIGASDLLAGTPHLVLGLVWQLVKIALLSSVNITAHPGLAVLLNEGEAVSELTALPAEHVLLRWLNWHLEQAGRTERVRNFGKDLSDSLAYTVVLARIAPASVGASLAPLSDPDLLSRAQSVVMTAAALGDVSFSISALDICKGNEKLNLAFVAALFNAAPGLELVSTEEGARLAALASARHEQVRARSCTCP